MELVAVLLEIVEEVVTARRALAFVHVTGAH